ncbi:formate dehydrogenase subunit delta [Chachezhania antarctica]|uniref:formate dehydrogenase subunit delta n=1 Tax=Chachezhania antarctica TaxID=2340860 RepID=UPI000EB280F7|nr:formate dehydrogenase subunit delta [Chachezhania antarctica]|tara:strand:- start:2747 stop:2953 length:207 start_codon:yes stop_codon:yes gene_type:complete
MSPEKMIYMANQIATFFKSQPGTNQAEMVANHLRDFWDPRMLRKICDHVAGGGEGLDDLAVRAVRMIP